MKPKETYALDRWALSLQRPALENLFEETQRSSELHFYAGQFAKELHLVDPKVVRISENEIIENKIGWERIQHIEAQGREIYAGCLFIVLNNWIQSLGHALGIRFRERINVGPMIGNVELTGLIWAAANNFRHYSEWKRNSAIDKRAKQSIDVLGSAGILNAQSQSCASVALDLIGVGSYTELEDKVLQIGTQLSEKI